LELQAYNHQVSSVNKVILNGITSLTPDVKHACGKTGSIFLAQYDLDSVSYPSCLNNLACGTPCIQTVYFRA
jgi:hypothetical protein